MDYEGQIERKADEYALKYMNEKYSDTNSMAAKVFFTSVKNDFMAGAEAMRAIANSWCSKHDKPKDGQKIIVTNNNDDMAIYEKDSRENKQYNSVAGYCENFTKWKPIEF
ncbi:hypothetical protein [Proteiniphilum acetatigenes]|uniref:hypothetical protein n=1 Tax=Proteiniphilum acetatigenes TaxID=294710 RepID=UPI0003608243|nr:hypothetical protein [Proteiniphilum acetatigenes]